MTFYHLIKKGSCEGLVKALARKSNTISGLYLEAYNTFLPSLLTSLINLKDLTIYFAEQHEINKDEIKEYFATWEPPVLQNIHISGLSCFRELAMLIENTKGNISQVSIISAVNPENTGMLVRAIANNCPNIKKLHAYIIPDDFIHIKSLLINCRSLVEVRFAKFDCYFLVSDNMCMGDELLDILAKFSPNSLIDITIDGTWKYSTNAFEQLFESYRERSKFNFGIYNSYFITESHKVIVKKYVKKGVIKETNDLFNKN